MAATAIIQKYDLNQSNTLPDGTNYGSVTLSADPSTGTVTIFYSVDLSKVPGPLSNFGLQEVALNTDLSLDAAQISADNGWDTEFGFQNISGFGQFNIVVAGKGSDRQTTETITVSGLSASEATLAHFTIDSFGQNSDIPSEGSVFFSAHEAGFGGAQSMFIGGQGVDVPEPSSFLAIGGGLCLLALGCWWKRKRHAAVAPAFAKAKAVT